MEITSVKEQKKITGHVKVIGYKAGTKEIVSEIEVDNLIMQGSYTGQSLILSALANDPTYPNIAINYIAIGTSQTAPAITDTQLGTEVARVGTASSQAVSVGAGTLTIQGFIPDANLTNGTYYEIGSFINGTASANSGQIFNHALLSVGYVKGNGQDTTIQIVFTIS